MVFWTRSEPDWNRLMDLHQSHQSIIKTPEINQLFDHFDNLLRGARTDARARAQVVAPPPPLCRFHTGCSFSSGSGSLQRTLPAGPPGLAPPPAGCSGQVSRSPSFSPGRHSLRGRFQFDLRGRFREQRRCCSRARDEVLGAAAASSSFCGNFAGSDVTWRVEGPD